MCSWHIREVAGTSRLLRFTANNTLIGLERVRVHLGSLYLCVVERACAVRCT